MSTSPRAIYLLKPSGDGDSIDINRTIKVIGDGDGPFDVLVTERDYLDGCSVWPAFLLVPLSSVGLFDPILI
jgi:hypothetical protein